MTARTTRDVAVDHVVGLLGDARPAVADPLDRLGDIAPAVGGLDVRSREVELVVADGGSVAVRLRTTARSRAGRPVDWAETHVVRVVDGRVAEVRPEFPARRIRALAAGRDLRWPAPRALVSTRIAAAAVAALARVGAARADRPTDVVGRYVEEFKNRQRFSVFPRLFAPGFRHHFDFPGRDAGLESFMSVGRDFLAAFTDLRVEVEALFGEGELVVERNRVRAVHRSTFAGVAPTGRAVTWTETHLYRVRAGRIVENWPGVDVERLVAGLA